MKTHHAFPFALLAAFGAACSSASNEDDNRRDGDSESAVRIKPDGSDRPGQLVVTVPAGAPELLELKQPTTVHFGDRQVALGKLLGPVPIGEQSFLMRSDSGSGRFWMKFKATIDAGKTTTIAAALLGVDVKSGPRTLGLGAYGDLSSMRLRPMPIAIDFNGEGGTLHPGLDASHRFPTVPGQYRVRYGLGQLDGVDVTIAPGGTTVATLTDVATRRVARLKAPIRELPDACKNEKRWLVRVKDAPNETTYLKVNDGDELDLGLATQNENRAYVLQIPQIRHPIDVPVGARGAGPQTLTLGRIDVDDVTVNGTEVYRGTYLIYRADAQGERIGRDIMSGSCQPATNTGVDVPPGRYRVEVTYTTTEAGEKTQVFVVDV